MKDGATKAGKPRFATDSPVLPFCHYGFSKNEEGKEEACLCGEELRNNTPCFSGKVYENIPDMFLAPFHGHDADLHHHTGGRVLNSVEGEVCPFVSRLTRSDGETFTAVYPCRSGESRCKSEFQ